MSDYFIFDDIDTRNYEGIYVYFDEVDTTPKRVGEFIEIPNRNGSLFLDGGRYEDVTHTYDIIALSKENGRNLINALASKVGHYRLEDSFNTGEYYSAAFDTEVEPTVTLERDKITFKVMFTRKPQRWLTSGETATTVANNGTLTNPTLFESSPMLEVTGYGTIGFNGYEIKLHNAAAGNVTLFNGGSELEFTTASTSALSWSKTVSTDITSIANAGDAITCGDVNFAILVAVAGHTIDTATLPADVTATMVLTPSSGGSAQRVVGYKVEFTASQTETVEVGQYGQFFSETRELRFNYKSQGYIGTTTLVFTGGISESNGVLTLEYGVSCISTSDNVLVPYDSYGKNLFTPREVIVESSKSYLGNPTYIDCDLGECYRIDGGQIMTLNQYIDLGSDLPKLASGTNTFTKENTITELKVTPRWWKV